MITEDYVSFETAKLLKEKGFDEGCFFVINAKSKGVMPVSWPTTNSDIEDEKANLIALPTLQMAMKWLREEHKIFIYIEPFITTSGLRGYKPYCTKIGGEFMWRNPLMEYNNTSSDTYELACDVAIQYCLTNLI